MSLRVAVTGASGLIGTGLRMIVLAAPKRMLTFVIVLAGVLSNIASDVGYVVLIPMGGMIFLAAGRHPIAGMAAGFAGAAFASAAAGAGLAGSAAGTWGFLVSSLMGSRSLYSGPLIPPSLRMRQKCTARKMAATSGSRITCRT